MPSFTDDAVVLASSPYGDRHLVLTVLTRRHGAVRGVLRGARGGRAPKTSATQILSAVRITAFQGPHAELATFKALELEQSSFPLASRLESAAAASVVAELLVTFCPVSEPAERRFRLGRSTLDAMLAGCDPRTAVAYVQFWVLVLGGVFPTLDRCGRCGTELDATLKVHPTDHHPVCSGCAPADAEELGVGSLRFLAACQQLPVAEVPGPPPRRLQRWLDRVVQGEAARSLKALESFRQWAGGDG